MLFFVIEEMLPLPLIVADPSAPLPTKFAQARMPYTGADPEAVDSVVAVVADDAEPALEA